MSDNQRAADADRIPAGPAASVPSASRELSICRRVVFWYAVAATVWIVASDLAVGAARGETAAQLADVGKGLVFVAVTATILWLVLDRLTRSYDQHFAREVTAQRDFFQSLVHTSSDVIFTFDSDGTILYASDAISEILGWTPEEVVGRRGRDLLHPGDRTSADSFRENIRSNGRNRRTFHMLCKDGSYRVLEVTLSEIALADGGRGAVINGRDVTERTRGEQQLRAALAEDATGLPNLRMFVAEMERLAGVSVVGLEAVVVLVDIDRFGDINALHGRIGGDAVLLELTRRLEASIPESIGMWRHGADEILVVLLDSPRPGGPGEVDLAELVERIQREASAPLALDDSERRLSVSVSVGAVRVPLDRARRDDALSSQMLRSVESALAEAKVHPDRSAVRVERSDDADDRAHMVVELHEGMTRGELVCHFQPKVRLSDLSVAGAEALIRWQHPERGLLVPGAFLQMVEEANLSAVLTRLVLRDSLSHVQGWLAQEDCDPRFALSVNVSLDDLRRRRFVDDVFDALSDSGVEPHRLCLELTEQTMLADTVGASAIVSTLRREGIQISIDDFGTGYSSLEHIRVFEVDELKIDKGFVQRIGRSRTDEAIVDSILAIAGRLGLRVTAEGIEAPAAVEYLRERGCHMGQGFLFSPAVPVEQFAPGWSWATLP